MIKMASIVPQNLLEMTADAEVQMALACFVGEEGYEKYTSFFQRKRKPDSFLILDNGVIEGNPMPFAECVKKALLIHADEVVLPDVYKNRSATFEAVQNAIDYYIRNMSFDHAFRLMVVPQGDSLDEWVESAIDLLSAFGPYISTVGVPKHLIDTCDNRDARLFAIHELASRYPELANYQIHLLGCWKTPLEVLCCAKAAEQGLIPAIRSCDSAIAYVYARKGMKFSDDDRPDAEAINFKTGTCNQMYLAYNILTWNEVGDPEGAKRRGVFFS